MSFIGDVNKGITYTPGYFLANGDENVVRETKEIAQDSALVVVSDNGAKHVPAGTAYPTNDGNAIGILYEDVDVTNGNMPGSVVTGNAEVYEDRLAVTGVDYTAVTPSAGDSPVEKGWYEKDGNNYVLSDDTTVDNQKTYYKQVDVTISSAAKTALEALGFKFIATAPAVTRPY